MGNTACELNCCHNNYSIKNNENEVVTNKRKEKLVNSKETNKDNNSQKDFNKKVVTENINNINNSIDEIIINNSSNYSNANNNQKLNNTTNFHQDVDKHIKDNSFKLNDSISEMDMNKRKKKLEELKNVADVLHLQVINGNSSIKKGTVITINCQGLIKTHDQSNINNIPNMNSINRYDGITYFGYYPDFRKNLVTNSLIDYNLDLNNYNNNSEDNSNNIGKHFLIEYSILKGKYIIKNLGIGYGTFWKLDYILNLRDNQLINIGQIFIVVNICDKEGNCNTNNNENSQSQNNNYNNSIASTKANQLKLKVYGINYDGDTFYFKPQNHSISIGRYELADVKLNDKLLSNIHCIIGYSEKEGKWKLMDGQVNKPSTNGTWIYINEEFEMYDKMIFKTNQTIFQADIQKITLI